MTRLHHARIWYALRNPMGQVWSVAEMAARVGCSEVAAYRWLLRLALAGVLASEASGRSIGRYWLARDLGPISPGFSPNGDLINPNLAGGVADRSQRLWNSLRICRSGRTTDLALASEVPPDQAYRLLSCWERFGLVRRPVRTGEGFWGLAKDLGPVAPICRFRESDDAQLYDPNSDQLHVLNGGANHDDATA